VLPPGAINETVATGATRTPEIFPMPEVHSQHRTGIVLVTAAAVAWSTAPFFTRLLELDSWTILFWRGLFGGGLITAFLLATQGRAGLRDMIDPGKSGWSHAFPQWPW
jgi:EamA domain-containing membrane protein RarD